MVVDIKNIVTRLPELRFTTPVNWRIDEGQQWAVIGPNGAGKTLIADIMQRNLFVGGLPEFLLPTTLAFDRDGGDAYCRGIVEGICGL